MKASKRKMLEDAGWTIGSASDFLELSEPEKIVVNMRVALAKKLRAGRKRLKLSQEKLAKRIGSSQSRIAKMEAAEKSISIDMYVRSLACLGFSQEEIGDVLAAKKKATKNKSVKKKVAQRQRKQTSKS
ncbi:helix-turn-helix domain-containing protein [Planctomycetaceae bacterium]|jgi:DNA-binding XRE family transcriptional regulator|nr:helix-turn-helix domain-containing protein [Planctomycetaceae bacterium]MDC0307615.1 helix-turn-helix domain-containing protein [Planctomycetaceae bacterium]MDG2388478.1 helix-turn-helix transcriptional regulator [Planctomycetaceae bacterium]